MTAPTPPDGLGDAGARLWADLTPEVRAHPWKHTLAVQAARTADACEWLVSVADDVDLSNTERRLAHAEAGRQRTVLARLVDQLRPATATDPTAPTTAAARLQQLRSIHGRPPGRGSLAR